MQPNGILETCLYVDDLDAAERFYQKVLGLEPLYRQPDRHVFFRCGRGMLLLFDPKGTSRPDSEVPTHGGHGPSHVAFAIADCDVDRWRSHLESHRVQIEKVIDWPQGGTSLYFRDPAGNSLEVATPRIWEGVG